MSEQLEIELLQQIEQLKQKISKLEGFEYSSIPTYTFSKIKNSDLEQLFDIKKEILNPNRFDEWFNSDIEIDDNIEEFLLTLIDNNKLLIKDYKEEDLKIKFLAPLLNKIRFESYENEFRDFYNEKITYKTDKFIFSGETDFVVAKGLVSSKKPYFFIQEFKRDEEYSNPRPQLIAELISAIELNDEHNMKGAYIIGSNWNFVILEKIDIYKYKYYISEDFNSMKIDDLKKIYKNLIFIKKDIIEKTNNSGE
jgi:hypothetical protein